MLRWKHPPLLSVSFRSLLFVVVMTAASLVMLIGAGCVERVETIWVHRDGSVDILVTYESENEAEFDDHDAAPSPAGGWEVERSLSQNDEGKTKYRLEAKASLPRNSGLPGTYADDSDAQRDVYLKFPSRLTIEERDDGTYYHFYRRYERRHWAQIGALKEALQKKVEGYEEQQESDESVTVADRKKLGRALVEFEVKRLETFARAAFIDVAPNAPQDTWLGVHESLTKLARDADYDQLAALMQEAEERNDFDRLEELAVELEETTMASIEAALRAAPAGHVHWPSFSRRFEYYEKMYDVTEDLADDAFQIDVRMPGRIVGSNGERVSPEMVRWRFNGQLLRDRVIECMVTSVVR